MRTISGDVPIERVKTGELVLTRQGYRRVLDSGMTAENATVLQVDLSDGRQLMARQSTPFGSKTGAL